MMYIIVAILFLKGVEGASHHLFPVKCKAGNSSSVCHDDTYKELKRFIHYQIERRIRDCNLQGCDTDKIITQVTETTNKDIEYLMAKNNLTDSIISTMKSSMGKLEQENEKLRNELVELKSENIDIKTKFDDISKNIETVKSDNVDIKQKVDNISRNNVPQGQVTECPTSWIQINDLCYYKSHIKRYWNDAQDDCLRRGAKLAEFDNDYEQFQAVFNSEPIMSGWVGGTGLKPFQWSFLGTAINDKMFAPNEPNSDNTIQCLHIWQGNGLDDAGCDQNLDFICEKKIVSP